MPAAENAKAPRVAELINVFGSGVPYKVMDEGKAHLARMLEKMYNAEEMVVWERNKQNIFEKRVVKHTFEAYHKLNPKIQTHYNILYGRPGGANKPESSTEQEARKAPRAFGFGAFQADFKTTDKGTYCACIIHDADALLMIPTLELTLPHGKPLTCNSHVCSPRGRSV